MNKTIRKVSLQLHLWLGLASGVVVVIVCITGCLYVFKDEINDATQPWRFVTSESGPVLPPSQVIAIADSLMGSTSPSAITYGEESDALFVDYFEPKIGMSTLYLNPYNGEILKTVVKRTGDFDFFRWVLNGHRTLWLPRTIGSPIVGYSVLLFLFTLLTGILLWWPKGWTWKAVRQRLVFRPKLTFTRFTFDLHFVAGGYAALLLIILCFTGLIFSLNWFSKAVYTITSGGEELKAYTLPTSDTLQALQPLAEPLDRLYHQLRQAEPDATTFYFALPLQKADVIRVSIVHQRGSYYQTDNLFFDRTTLAPLQGSGPYAGRYTEASLGDTFRRMNLEIHDGRIFGLPGKILMFLASLVGASLPITGFVIWWRKRRAFKKKSSAKHKPGGGFSCC